MCHCRKKRRSIDLETCRSKNQKERTPRNKSLALPKLFVSILYGFGASKEDTSRADEREKSERTNPWTWTLTNAFLDTLKLWNQVFVALDGRMVDSVEKQEQEEEKQEKQEHCGRNIDQKHEIREICISNTEPAEKQLDMGL